MIILYLFLSAAVVLLIAALIMIRLKCRIKSVWMLNTASPEAIPQHVIKIIDANSELLISLGFSFIGVFQESECAVQTDMYVAIWRNDEARDMASAMYFISSTDPDKQIKAANFEFCSKFKIDKSSVCTINCVLPAPLKMPMWKIINRLPGELNLKLMYAVHKNEIEKCKGKLFKIIPDLSKEREQVIEDSIIDLAYQTETGYLYADKNHNVHKPTWKGAAYMLICNLFPIKQMVGSSDRKRAKAMIAQVSKSF